MRYNTFMQNSALPPVKLEAFEGPYDLLIELARKRKVDLAEISLRQVTDDFLVYMNKHVLSPSAQADFLIVAATLMLIKIRQLLPQLTQDEEQEIETLTDRVRIYNLYRQKAANFITQWGRSRLLPAHFWAAKTPTFVELPVVQPDISTEQLQTAFQSVISKLPKPPRPRAHLTVQGRTMQEWLQVLTERLTKVRQLVFQDTLRGSSREDTAISFLALLELARKRKVEITQTDTFAELVIKRSA